MVLSCNNVTHYGVDFLTEALLANPNTAVYDLDLSENPLNYSGVKSLSKYLQHPSCKVSKLNVEEC